MNTRNHEHYKDKTAHDAIKAADKYPSTIYIRMDNGETVKYERGKKC